MASTASLNAPDLLDFTKVSLYSRYGLIWDSSIHALQKKETKILCINHWIKQQPMNKNLLIVRPKEENTLYWSLFSVCRLL